VVAALESLGYSGSEARRAAGAVAGTDGELDVRIKAALQELARSR
jgi:Holliday junction resolvasome RuvABC DNA-binding subunit